MTLLLPDGTPWTGPARVVEKAATGIGVGFWNTGVPLESIQRSPQQMMKRAQLAYHVNPWVKLAEATITRKVVGMPWHLEDGEDEEYPDDTQGAVAEARLLLERPQFLLGDPKPGTATRRLMMALTTRHVGLCGMSYWYGDQIGTSGIPKAWLYINPARMWPSEDAQGNLTGWVLDAQDNQGNGGTPLQIHEVLPFYLDPPDWGHLGTGWYEGIVLKSQITNLGDQHAAYVIGTGGRIAGIVSPKEGTIPDEKFKALVAEFRNVNEAPDAAKRTTILQGPVDFTPTAANPQELNLVELSKMNRDDILAEAGVPPTQASIPSPAGLNSGATKGFDEAILMQGAVHDRVVAIRETLQYGFLDKYLPLVIELEFEEPEFDDKSPAFALLTASREAPLTNAQRLELIGIPPTGDPAIDNAILLPSTITMWATAPEEGKTEGVIEGQEEEEPPLDIAALMGAVPAEEEPLLKAMLDLTQDEIDEEVLDDEMDGKAGPAFIFGKPNPAYHASASKEDVDKELDAIKKRAQAAGLHPTDAQIRATYKKNLARKQKQAIGARAKKKSGKQASKQAIAATLARNIARDPRLAKLLKAENEAMKARSDPLHLRKSLDTRIVPSIRRSVKTALDAQRTEIVSKVRAKGAHLQSRPTDQRVWWNEDLERERLTQALRPHLAGIAETVTKRASSHFEAKADNFAERVIAFVVKRGAERIKQMLDTTRDAIQSAITKGFDDGLSPAQVADLLQESTTFDEARAELVARTESALAYNDAALNSYTEFGVEMVEPIDGDEDPECIARLERGPVTIDEALADTDHPNGTLDWVPYFGKAQLWQPVAEIPQDVAPVTVNVQPPMMPRPAMRLIIERDDYGKIRELREAEA